MNATAWTVHTSWRALSNKRAEEVSLSYPNRAAARSAGLHACCLSGVRYVTVVDPEHVVVFDFDRYTNRWREYPQPAAERPTCPPHNPTPKGTP